MDKEQEELQSLGFFGICKESLNIIWKWRKILLQITLSLILPLSFIFLANTVLSSLFLAKIQYSGYALFSWAPASSLYSPDSSSSSSSSSLKYSKLMGFWIVRVTYLAFLMGLSLLSTSAVVYTIACIYTGKEVTFKKVLSVVPKVWMRLVVTFVCNFVAVLCYNVVVSFLLSALWARYVDGRNVDLGTQIVLGFSCFLLQAMGLVYIIVIWQLGSAVTVLEESYGVKALMKSQALMKGKMWLGLAIFVMINLFAGLTEALFGRYVVGRGSTIGFADKVAYGVLSLMFLSGLFLFGLVVETVFYFVCKSYHGEGVDKSSSDSSDRLDDQVVYFQVDGNEALLEVKNLQLEQV